MKFKYAFTLVAALAAPLVVSAEHDGGRIKRDIVYTTVVESASPVTLSTSVASNVVRAAKSSQSSTAPTVAPSKTATSGSTSASSGTSSSSSSCTGSGMNIEWSGDEVAFSWSNGSGNTTGCTSLGEFNGQLEVGGSGGTIFEGNYDSGDMYFDVSFITGYSVPMMCSSDHGMSGCSIDLASRGVECPQKSGSVCTNPVGENGNKQPGLYQGEMASSPWCRACSAPDPFFQPCAGSGYTYPYDDGATMQASGTIKCCIGTSCGSSGREGSTKDGHAEPSRSSEPCQLCSDGENKRGLDDAFDRYARDARAFSPSLMPRGHRRASHRHGTVHGSK